MRPGLAAICLALLAAPAVALETTRWPPPEGVAERMKALQQALRDPQASAAQREAAREELAGLLKSPAGQAKGRSRDDRPARAAIDPHPTVLKPAPRESAAPPPASGVARLEIIEPPKPVANPRTGSVAPRIGGFAIDPRSGNVLHETPAGFVDPKTGQLVPR